MWDEAAKGFEFEIGRAVYHKADGRRVVVIEQTLARCHGGVQRAYVCCTGETRYHYNAAELSADPPPDLPAKRWFPGAAERRAVEKTPPAAGPTADGPGATG